MHCVAKVFVANMIAARREDDNLACYRIQRSDGISFKDGDRRKRFELAWSLAPPPNRAEMATSNVKKPDLTGSSVGNHEAFVCG
jgi:hypothetical protein